MRVELIPIHPGDWVEFLTWATPFLIVCLALIVVASAFRVQEWSDMRAARAEFDAAWEAAGRPLDRRSSRVRAVEALTEAIEVVAVPVDATIIAEAPETPHPEATVLP